MADEVNVVLKVSEQGFDKVTKDIAALRSQLESAGVDMSEFNKRLDSIEKTATRGARANKEVAKSNRDISTTAKGAADATKAQADAADRGARANKTLADSTDLVANPSTRYALYDVSNAYRLMGASMAGAAIYAAIVGARFEAAFTNVERTLQAGTAPEQIDQIRSSLVQLSGQIPLTFQELSQIATIGNQMGIAKESIVDFTGTIARFSSVAGISIDETTKSFGGFMAQTGLAPKYLENLGSAIAKVGLDSNATEAQILSLMREITAGATSAGFTADQIVGLAGTLASLQIAPERARGTLTTYFETLNKAVADGGERLQNFATITGLTADELSRMVDNGEGAEVFRRFMTGLGDTTSTSKATEALEALGLSQLRVTDTFRRLSSRMDLYQRDQENANNAFMEGAELSNQYALTMDDLASQWQIFINGINGLVDAISGGAVPTLGALLAGINNVIFALTDFLGRNKWVAGAAALTVAIVGVIGTMVLFRAMLLAGTAATYAMRTAIAQMGAQAVASAGTVRGFASAVWGVRTASIGAAGGVNGLKWAIRGLLASTGIGIVVGLLGMGAEALANTGTEAQDAALNLQTYKEATATSASAMQDATGAAEDFAGGGGGGLSGAGKAAEETAKKVRTLVDYVADLSGVMRRSSSIRFGSTEAMDEVTLKWIELNEQAEEYQRSIRTLTADRKLKQYWLDIANLYDDQIRASELREEIAKIDDDLAVAQAGASTELRGNSKAAIENRKKMRELLGGYEAYIEALAAAGVSQKDIQKIISQLNGDFTAQAKALGFSGGELATYRDRFTDLSTIIAQVPRDVTVAFNANPALQALGEFFAKAEEQARAAGADAGEAYGDGLGSGFPTDTWDDLFPPKTLTEGKGRSMASVLKEGMANGFKTLGFAGGDFYGAWLVDTFGEETIMAAGQLNYQFINEFVRGIPVIGPMIADSLLNAAGIPLRNAGTTLGRDTSAGFRTSVTSGFQTVKPIDNWANSQYGTAYNKGRSLGLTMGAAIGGGISEGLSGKKVGLTFTKGHSAGGYVSGFSGGGYTGAGHWLTPAGFVHKGEYVVPKKHVNQSTGLPDVNYVANLQRGRSAPKGGYATGGHVGNGGFNGLTELGPATIGALINGMSVRLNVGREQLATATSGGNKRLAFTGSN